MKYGSKTTVVDGIKFPSKKEAERWTLLRLLERAGKIAGLERQVSYELIPSKRRSDGVLERACTYVADFRYFDTEKQRTVVEDVKGMKTPAYVLKRKLMLHVHGIEVRET